MKTWGIERQQRGGVLPPSTNRALSIYNYFVYHPASPEKRAEERLCEEVSAENEEKEKEKVDELGEEGQAWETRSG